jgi:hypothetical protein
MSHKPEDDNGETGDNLNTWRVPEEKAEPNIEPDKTDLKYFWPITLEVLEQVELLLRPKL